MNRLTGRLGFIAMVLVFAAGAALGQQPRAAHVTPNFKDADFANVVQAVSAATGKSFIIDPRVRARVTMFTSTVMSPAAFYDAFLELLPTCGFVAVPEGNLVKILPATKVPPPTFIPVGSLIRVGLSDFSSVSCVAQ